MTDTTGAAEAVGEFATVVAEMEDTTGILTLNRPDNANSFNQQMATDVVDAVEALRKRRARVLVVTGAGRHFCAGADLKALAVGEGPTLGDRSFIDVFEELRIPVIAAINGGAIGGGCELALACDLRVISEDARIGLPEVKFGGLAAGGGTQRLPRLVGPGWAKQMLFLGEPLSAAEAMRIGLVNWAVPADELRGFVFGLAATLAERPAYALESAKFLVNKATDVDLRTGQDLELYVARKMATAEQRKAAQSEAATSGGAYKKIFEERG
jgi:enoyl-CoA hydratase/carnithine racemase